MVASSLNWRAWLSVKRDPIDPSDVGVLLEAMDAEIGQLKAAARAVVEAYDEALQLRTTYGMVDPIDALRAAVEAADG